MNKLETFGASISSYPGSLITRLLSALMTGLAHMMIIPFSSLLATWCPLQLHKSVMAAEWPWSILENTTSEPVGGMEKTSMSPSDVPGGQGMRGGGREREGERGRGEGRVSKCTMS